MPRAERTAAHQEHHRGPTRRSQQSTPFGLGTKCIGPTTIFRLSPATPASHGGVLTRTVDLGALSPAGAIVAGDTIFFQAWFRSSGSFDLSDALQIDFVR